MNLTSLQRTFRTWKLPIAIVAGILLGILFDQCITDAKTLGQFYYVISHFVQPTLLFLMLFLSFLRVSPHDLRPHRWHLVLLFVQASFFILCSMVALLCDYLGLPTLKLLAEGAMLCFVCPTATASAVIVRKLGGSISGIVTYMVLCNLMVALLSPAFLTLVDPHPGMGFLTESALIMGKVFPLLLCPLLLAILLRHYAWRLAQRMLSVSDLPFYLWLVALPLAIMVSVHTLLVNSIALSTLLCLALISAVICVIQFYLGRKVGVRWQQPCEASPEGIGLSSAERSAITAGQAFGQKNTVFAIWMGLVFLNPISSVVGGFYSIWHNLINSWQLYRVKR